MGHNIWKTGANVFIHFLVIVVIYVSIHFFRKCYTNYLERHENAARMQYNPVPNLRA